LVALVLTVTFGATFSAQHSSPRQVVNHDPDAAKLVTADLHNFVRAQALAEVARTTAEKARIFKRQYLDKGSPGLRDFLKLRIKSADNLVRVTEARPKYYDSLKEVTLRIPEMEPAIRESFRKLKRLYPDAVFSDVYFMIGVMNSGGTTGPSGLLIGVDMDGRRPDTDMAEMNSWLKTVLASVTDIPGIVAHELIHEQQGPGGETLLGQSIREGAADLIGEMISGQNINAHLRPFGQAHERELWREFRESMNGSDFSRWLSNGNESTDRPADLGYYMGYRIAKAYFEQAEDKRHAVSEILNVRDYSAFLRQSRYAEQFPVN
jgi:hypothetical protein